VESPCEWEFGEKLSGESGSHEVINPDGLKAVAKPSVAHNDGVSRAAHEKIAADLAHHVDVPIPAVTLWTNCKNGKSYAISRWAFPECQTWAGATRLGLITQEYVHAARPLISVGAVFHTWIANSDPNHENVMIDLRAPPPSPGLAFIDHAFSMGQFWRSENEQMQKAGTDYCGAISLLPGPMAEVVAKIHSLDERLIREIIGRVPDKYLPSDRRRIIIANILRRREQLAGIFGVV
jgi:hypothetical protein